MDAIAMWEIRLSQGCSLGDNPCLLSYAGWGGGFWGCPGLGSRLVWSRGEGGLPAAQFGDKTCPLFPHIAGAVPFLGLSMEEEGQGHNYIQIRERGCFWGPLSADPKGELGRGPHIPVPSPSHPPPWLTWDHQATPQQDEGPHGGRWEQRCLLELLSGLWGM